MRNFTLLGLIITMFFFSPTPTMSVPPAQVGINQDYAVITAANIGQIKEVATIKGAKHSLAFSPNGSTLALGGDDGSIQLLDMKTNATLLTLDGSTELIISLAFSPDGKLLASGSSNFGETRVWNLQTGQQLAGFECYAGCYSLAFSADGKLLFGGEGGEFGAVNIWDIATKTKLTSISDGSDNYIVSMALSPDGKLLAVGKIGGGIQILESATQKQISEFEGESNKDQPFTASSVTFNPDGKLIASGSRDGMIVLWNLQTNQEPKVLKGHTNWIGTVAFSPDGKLLVSASEDKSFRLWDADTGTELRLFADHTKAVHDVAFSPDGKLIVSASADGTVKFWGIAR